jgi:hypothetical protein
VRAPRHFVPQRAGAINGAFAAERGVMRAHPHLRGATVMADRLTATYMIDEAALVRASRAMTNRKRSPWLMYGLSVLFLTGGIAHLLGLFPGMDPLSAPWYAAIIGAGVVMGASTWFAPYQMVRTLTKGIAEANGPHTWSLSPDGIEIRSPTAALTLQWLAVRQIWEDSEFLYFYTAESFAQLLPKAALSPEDLACLRVALNSWLGSDATIRNRTRTATSDAS